MAFKGIDIRSSGDRIIFRVSLKDSTGAKITSGTASLRIYEIQSDGTLKTYDFNDNTFKTTTVTTETQTLTHRTANNGATNTGVWTFSLTTVSGFSSERVYVAQVSHTSASPADQEREFQYGGVQGDDSSQTGDAYARIGAGGAGLTALGDTRIANLDINVNSRSSHTAAQAGTDAASKILSTPANLLVTNGAGKVDINDKTGFELSVAGILAIWHQSLSAIITSGSIGKKIKDWVLGSDNKAILSSDAHTGAVIPTVSVLTNHTPQSGDAFSRLGLPANASIAADIAQARADVQDIPALVWDEDKSLHTTPGTYGVGVAVISLSSQAQTDVRSALTAQGYTTTRAAYLDKMNVTGNLASSSEVTAIQNNTRIVKVVPSVIERPDSGTQTYVIHLYLYDDIGNMEAPDSAPTVALTNQAGTDLSARLDSTTMALVGTGHYKVIYTASSAHALEQLLWEFTVIEGGVTRLVGDTSLLVDTSAVDFTSADRAKLDLVHSKMPSKSYLTGTVNADGDIQLDEATGALVKGIGVTGFNDLSSANVQTAAAAALTAYDPPTEAEMNARTLPSASYALEPTLTAIKGGSWSNESLKAIKDAVDLRLLASAYTAPPTASENATGLLDLAAGVETGLTLRQALRLVVAAEAGKLSGAATATIVIRNVADDKNRITATVTEDGDRTALVYDLT